MVNDSVSIILYKAILDLVGSAVVPTPVSFTFITLLEMIGDFLKNSVLSLAIGVAWGKLSASSFPPYLFPLPASLLTISLRSTGDSRSEAIQIPLTQPSCRDCRSATIRIWVFRHSRGFRIFWSHLYPCHWYCHVSLSFLQHLLNWQGYDRVKLQQMHPSQQLIWYAISVTF